MRRLLPGLSAVVLLAVGGMPLLLLTLPAPGITEENYEQIREGMTEPEVEAILGAPAGNYSGDQYAWYVFAVELNPCPGGFLGDTRKRSGWIGENWFAVDVQFDHNGTVCGKSGDYLPPHKTFWDRLRCVLPW